MSVCFRQNELRGAASDGGAASGDGERPGAMSPVGRRCVNRLACFDFRAVLIELQSSQSCPVSPHSWIVRTHH